MTPVELLQAGKERLLRHGWMQKETGLPNGRSCAYGALIFSVNGDYDPVNHALTFLERSINSTDWYPLTVWNDKEDRTFNEVMDLYDEAILLAKEHEAERSNFPISDGVKPMCPPFSTCFVVPGEHQ